MAEGESKKNALLDNIPCCLPLLPVRDIVVYPYMILPLFVGREKSIRAVEQAVAEYDRKIFLVAQKDSKTEDPSPDEIFRFGTVGNIMKLLKLPDGRLKILVHGLIRAELKKYKEEKNCFIAKIKKIIEKENIEHTLEVEALMRNVKSQMEKSLSLGKAILPDVVVIANNIDDPGKLADLIVSNLVLKTEETQSVLEIIDPVQRLKRVNELLSKELEVLAMQKKIQSQAKEEMDKDHREYYLRQQLKAIQHELGQVDERTEEINELKAKIEKANLPEEARNEAEKQLSRLAKMHPEAAESGMVRSYLEWLIEIPWNISTEDNLDIAQASRVLDEDHYDLEKVKERILEYLSVRKLKKNKMKGPILCFVGPPGVGKTSLGKSIARALGRKFVRISLGGVRDEAEIRGHRRTYIGSLPGRIIQGIRQAGSNNPVFMMDEVDKIGADFRGDPSAALLEVLDPEQNSAFTDHYLGLPFDLSNVMFIATANLLDPILPAFRDRMEIIHLPGYTDMEKLKIAKKYLIPKQLEENGITDKDLVISDQAVLKIINEYTREAGLRNLEREIATICRKCAKRKAEGSTRKVHVFPRNLHQYLGVPAYQRELEYKSDEVGVATGLAWTEAGGDIIHIEATTMKGKGALILTGHLGEIMKESAQAALSFARSEAEHLGIKENHAEKDIHIHIPAGAIPKDGPSAGVTMATSLVSLFTNRPVRKDVAMTGEITLRGHVLPVGGLKQKVLAAKRMGITNIIVPARNKKDIQEIPKHVRQNIHFIYAESMKDILEVALKNPNGDS